VRPQSAIRNVEGFILAGGKSSRFGGDKALATWNGRPLLAHSTTALNDLMLTPRVVCRDPLPYFKLAKAFVTSERPDLGPLEGLRVALKSCLHEFALVLSADMPLVRAHHLYPFLAIIEELTLTVAPTMAAVFKSAGGIRHPFPGLYPRSALSVIDSLPTASSLQALLDRIPLRELEPDPEMLSALRGVNTPADLQSL
jgi:molybdopterin-guanine dinucleotide biosynthesis protein A